MARYTVSSGVMSAERNYRARESTRDQRRAQRKYAPAAVRSGPNFPGSLQKAGGVLLLGLIGVFSLALTYMVLPFLYKGIYQVVRFLLALIMRMGSVLASPGIFIFRKLTRSNVKPTSAGVTEIQYQATTRPTTAMSSTTETSISKLAPTAVSVPLSLVAEPLSYTDSSSHSSQITYTLVYTLTTTETSITSIPTTETTTETSVTSIPTTITTREQPACPTPPLLPPTSSEINLSSGVFWSIYIPLVAIAIAIVGSHIYLKHQTLLLEHKRLDKEIKSIKTGKKKAAAAEYQG